MSEPQVQIQEPATEEKKPPPRPRIKRAKEPTKRCKHCKNYLDRELFRKKTKSGDRATRESAYCIICNPGKWDMRYYLMIVEVNGAGGLPTYEYALLESEWTLYPVIGHENKFRQLMKVPAEAFSDYENRIFSKHPARMPTSGPPTPHMLSPSPAPSLGSLDARLGKLALVKQPPKRKRTKKKKVKKEVKEEKEEELEMPNLERLQMDVDVEVEDAEEKEELVCDVVMQTSNRGFHAIVERSNMDAEAHNATLIGKIDEFLRYDPLTYSQMDANIGHEKLSLREETWRERLASVPNPIEAIEFHIDRRIYEEIFPPGEVDVVQDDGAMLFRTNQVRAQQFMTKYAGLYTALFGLTVSMQQGDPSREMTRHCWWQVLLFPFRDEFVRIDPNESLFWGMDEFKDETQIDGPPQTLRYYWDLIPNIQVAYYRKNRDGWKVAYYGKGGAEALRLGLVEMDKKLYCGARQDDEPDVQKNPPNQRLAMKVY